MGPAVIIIILLLVIVAEGVTIFFLRNAKDEAERELNDARYALRQLTKNTTH